MSPGVGAVDGLRLGGSIVAEHVSKDVLGVLKSLGHFCIVRFECLIQRQVNSLTFLVHIGHNSALRVQKDLGLVLEVHLNDLVAESEHDRVLGSHPFLNIHMGCSSFASLVSHCNVSLVFCVSNSGGLVFEIRSEMLK